MKVLVTGASGNVGRFVVKNLVQQGEEVVAAGKDLEKLKNLVPQDIEMVTFNFLDPATHQKALENIDRVFLMRPPHLGQPVDLYPFIEAMKEADIKLVSFLSLMGIEKNPIPPHYKIEKFIESSGIPYAHIRPGFFMQNLSGIHSVEIKEKGKIFVPAGKSRTSFVDAEDVGAAAATVLQNPETFINTVHTITGAEALNYYQAAEILSRVTGRKIVYAHPSFFKYRNYYIHERKLEKDYVNVTAALYLMTRMGTAKEVTKDFIDLTGRSPRSFEEFARAHKKYFS